MSKRKYCYEFTEHRQYKCCECGRTMHKPTAHYCNGQYRKHNLEFLKKDYEKGIAEEGFKDGRNTLEDGRLFKDGREIK